MLRTVAIYGLILAVTALLLEWLGYRHALFKLDTNLYVVGLAVIFTAIGVWVGFGLTRRRPLADFQPNEQALASLGITVREREVLHLMAAGRSNKEIARELNISPNTVKTHVASVYTKLEATRRTDAVQKARALEILP